MMIKLDLMSNKSICSAHYSLSEQLVCSFKEF